MASIVMQQEAICRRYGVVPFPVSAEDKVGISRNVKDRLLPINGVRCRPENGTSGWYIWAGEDMSTDADFFAPLHVSHLADWCPAVIQFLLLPPGWRFLLADDYFDVWFDPEVDLTPVGAA